MARYLVAGSDSASSLSRNPVTRPGISIGLGGGSIGGGSRRGVGIGMGSVPKQDYIAIISVVEREDKFEST